MTPTGYHGVANQPYFHDYLNNIDQVNRLAMCAKNFHRDVRGVFFVRPSLRDHTALTLTVVQNRENIRHFRVLFDSTNNLVCCNRQHKVLPHIQALVAYHRLYSFHEDGHTVPGLKLTSPILRTMITDSMRINILYGQSQTIKTPFHDPSKPERSLPSSTFEVEFGPPSCLGSGACIVRVTKVPNDPNNNIWRHPVTVGPGRSHRPGLSETIPKVPEVRPQTVGAGSSGRKRLPLPVGPRSSHRTDSKTLLGAEGENIYSEPTPSDRNRALELMDNLRRDDVRHAEVCHCGILVEEGVMPLKWTLHRDTSTGRVFFQSDKGNTQWDIPDEIKQFLTDPQKRVILKYT